MHRTFFVLYGDAASKLFETWLPIYAEKILYLARQEGKLTLPLDGLTPGNILVSRSCKCRECDGTCVIFMQFYVMKLEVL